MDSVSAMEFDGQGNLWVASYGRPNRYPGQRGLHRFDGTTWTHYQPKGDRIFSGPRKGQYPYLVSDSLTDIRRLRDGRLAIASNGGYSLYRDGSFISYDRYDPTLKSNYINSIIEDPDGRLWLTHAFWGAGVSWRAGLIRPLILKL